MLKDLVFVFVKTESENVCVGNCFSVLIYSNTSQTILPNVTEAECCDLSTSSGLKLTCFCPSDSVLGAEPHQVCQLVKLNASVQDQNKRCGLAFPP